MSHYKRFEDIKQPGFYFATDTKAVSEKPYRRVVEVESVQTVLRYNKLGPIVLGLMTIERDAYTERREVDDPEQFIDFTGPFVDELTQPIPENDLATWYERERATASPCGIISGDVKPDNPLRSEPY